MGTQIYHEKQRKSLCALHTLNNLLQEEAFTQEDLDTICKELDPNAWFNQHKSLFGIGNYDINVIMAALQRRKLQTIWFNKATDPSDEELNFSNIYGFILNIPSDNVLSWLIVDKHWMAIRDLPSAAERDAGTSNYYNLNSKLDNPQSIGTTGDLIDYLRVALNSPEKELFVVVTEDIGRLGTWRRNPPPSSSSSTTTSISGSASESKMTPSSSESTSKYFTTKNENVHLSGNGNQANVQYSENCTMLANNSKLLMDTNNAVNLSLTDSTAWYINGKNVTANGKRVTLLGEDVTNCLMYGVNNALLVENSEGVVLSGSQGKCVFTDSQSPKVYGKENSIVGKSNSGLVVCGHSNEVVANQNENLKVLGHTNQVVATRTHNVSVQGNNHQVSMQDIAIHHVITMTPRPPVQAMGFAFSPRLENRMEFHGEPADCNVLADIMCPAPITRFYYKAGMEDSYKSENARQKFTLAEKFKVVYEKFLQEINMESTAKMPQVQIRYVDQAYINQEDYIIGIFHVNVAGLSLVHQKLVPIRIKILDDKLDAGTYSFKVAPTQDMVTFTGSLNGNPQLLCVTGNHITENPDNSFYVFFEQIAEAQAAPENDEEGDSFDIEMD